MRSERRKEGGLTEMWALAPERHERRLGEEEALLTELSARSSVLARAWGAETFARGYVRSGKA